MAVRSDDPPERRTARIIGTASRHKARADPEGGPHRGPYLSLSPSFGLAPSLSLSPSGGFGFRRGGSRRPLPPGPGAARSAPRNRGPPALSAPGLLGGGNKARPG